MEKKGTDTEIGKEDDERRTDLILEKISELLKRKENLKKKKIKKKNSPASLRRGIKNIMI